MLINFNINNYYDSTNLLFSIPIHEKQDIVNNQIENILNYNPNSKIILHVNRSFKQFDPNQTIYPNVFINRERFNYQYAKGLLWIHINNYWEAIKLKIDFKYFIIISSNEMFIKPGLNKYINEFKNGVQMVKYNENIKWHNFQKNLQDSIQMKNLLLDINLDSFYGGQTEGNFYEKEIFHKIAEIYIKHYGNSELNNFETEEIISQTIFKSFHLNYALPFTLQNYSNNIIFNKTIIDKIRLNEIIIPNNFINSSLLESPHINKDCRSIFAIKRVDRTYNEIRDYLSNKGFMINKSFYQLNTYYYSNNSSIYLYNNNYFHFKKKSGNREYQWFGIELDLNGYFILNFEIKSNKDILNYNEKVGIKFNDNIIYNFFLENLNIGVWKNISVPFNFKGIDTIKFIFDEYNYDLDLEFKNININILNTIDSTKENIIICLYEKNMVNNMNYNINLHNIYNKIIKPFEKIYNIYIFISLFQFNSIINYYKPYHINIIPINSNINDIFILNNESIINFSENINIDIKFIIYFDIESIFKKSIIDFNFYVNKFNIISYFIPYINNTISNSYEFMSVPFKYIYIFYKLIYNNKDNPNICHLIYSNLKDSIGINNFNFIYDDNYTNSIRTPLIKYLSEINNIGNNNGYLLNSNYLYDIIYFNKFSKLIKFGKDEFYFYKKSTSKPEPFQWLGLEYLGMNLLNKLVDIKVVFEINLLKNINSMDNINFGLKTHEPSQFLKDWIINCTLSNYTKIELNLNISNKKQFIILNFDDYLGEIEFYIKDFKIIIDYNK